MSIFGDCTVDGVTNAVKAGIAGFDNTVNSVTNLMSFNLKGDQWAPFWDAANAVSSAISGVAICIAVIYTYVAITREGLTLKGDFKKIITILLRLCIAKGLIDSATDFMFWIYSFGAKITTIVGSKLGSGSDSLESVYNPSDLAKGLGLTDKSSAVDCFVNLQYARVLNFFLWGLGIALIIIAVSRILKIYTMTMFSSIAFAKLPLEGYNSIKEYISNFFALSLQGAIILGAIGLYKIGVANSSIISSIFTDSMFGSFGIIVILSISLVLIIFQSEKIAKMHT